jgi:hypothetical protein
VSKRTSLFAEIAKLPSHKGHFLLKNVQFIFALQGDPPFSERMCFFKSQLPLRLVVGFQKALKERSGQALGLPASS